jgi:hypothetical protein
MRHLAGGGRAPGLVHPTIRVESAVLLAGHLELASSACVKGRANEAVHRQNPPLRPVFGQIKQGRGFRQFLMRGIEKVRAEWAIICTTHNLLKLAQGRSLSAARPTALEARSAVA